MTTQDDANARLQGGSSPLVVRRDNITDNGGEPGQTTAVDDMVDRDETNEETTLMGTNQELFPSQQFLKGIKKEIEQRRKEDIYKLKPVAVVESNQKHDYYDLEESLINFLLEKAVVMREVPFMRAIEKLERNNNVNKIYEQISKITGVGNFAGR